MRNKTILMIALVAAGHFAHAATIKGTISTSKTDKAKEIKMSADPACVKAAGGKVMDDTTVITNGKVKDVFVWLKAGVKPGTGAKLTNQVVLDQKACMYHPKVSGVMVDQPLLIKNSDPFLHNVHSMAKNNKPGFNIGMATAGQSKEVKFTKEEVLVKVKCDVHGWMTTYIGVSPHPYFAVTDSNGNFEIKDVPPGEYTVEAVHPKLKSNTTKVTVKAAGDTVTSDIELGGKKSAS